MASILALPHRATGKTSSTRMSTIVSTNGTGSPQTLALFSGPNVPGFAAQQQTNNRLISIQDIHSFSSTVINEARIGYNFIRQTSSPLEPVKDSDVGIKRSNA